LISSGGELFFREASPWPQAGYSLDPDGNLKQINSSELKFYQKWI